MTQLVLNSYPAWVREKTNQAYQCPNHGASVIPRPLARQTREQTWCGRWFDCQRCGYSVLERSPELVAFLNQQLQSLKTAYDKLLTKRAREKFLKYSTPPVVNACVNNVFLT